MLYPQARFLITFKPQNGNVMTDELGDISAARKYARALERSAYKVLEVRDIYHDAPIDWKPELASGPSL